MEHFERAIAGNFVNIAEIVPQCLLIRQMTICNHPKFAVTGKNPRGRSDKRGTDTRL
jgi:hypothetical protein